MFAFVFGFIELENESLILWNFIGIGALGFDKGLLKLTESVFRLIGVGGAFEEIFL